MAKYVCHIRKLKAGLSNLAHLILSVHCASVMRAFAGKGSPLRFMATKRLLNASFHLISCRGSLLRRSGADFLLALNRGCAPSMPSCMISIIGKKSYALVVFQKK